jgi:DNA-binding transcriptional LysR family regulator
VAATACIVSVVMVVMLSGDHAQARRPRPHNAWLLSHDVMELRQLDAFVAVARAGSFTRAAEQLGVVQPAVSQAVRRLEEELGLTLFERTSRRVTPTAAGAAFLPHADAVLARLAEARQAAAALAAGEVGAIRVAGTGGAAATLRRLRDALRERYPEARVEVARVQPKPKLQAVLDGDLDAALTRSAPRTPGLAFTELATEPSCAIVAVDHPLADRRRVALAQLAPYPLAVIARHDPERRRAELAAVCRAAGIEPTPGPVLANVEDALTAIATSQAWTLVAAGRHDAARSGAVELALVDEVEPFRLWLAHRTEPSPATRRLLEVLGAGRW